MTIKGFENIRFNDISGIGIPELLMNIMSYYRFVKNKKSTVILSCCRKLVDHNLSKVFVIIENDSSNFSDVPLCVKQITNE